MSNPKVAPQDFAGTNNEWSGLETGYVPGMVWPESMFPHVLCNPRIYGPADPLDGIPPSGPFDDEEGDQAWRKSHHSTHVYTGESIVHASPPPTAGQQERRMQFWASCDAQTHQSAAESAQGQGQGPLRTAAGEEQHLLDDLSTRSSPATTSAPTLDTSTQQVVAPCVVNAARTASFPTSVPSDNRSDIDGEHKLDQSSLSNAPQQSAPTGHSHEHRKPEKTSSPRGVNDWDDANLLSLWKFKVIRKKGYKPMLATFTNQTVVSLRETWRKNKERCQQLGVSWEAAGKPSGALEEWFEE